MLATRVSEPLGPCSMPLLYLQQELYASLHIVLQSDTSALFYTSICPEDILIVAGHRHDLVLPESLRGSSRKRLQIAHCSEQSLSSKHRQMLAASCFICRNLAKHLAYLCLTFTICLFPAPINLLRTSLPGELRLAPHAPNPCWHMFLVLLLL